MYVPMPTGFLVVSASGVRRSVTGQYRSVL
jgi:hypothetical protein